ncbi:hypothetical protein K0M31_000871 [Melipona bicolor]|uniref:Peptidase S1 domain-containing protein n=1 Tax=Melipona bicolor TaxID=60889 RepID=A0AA40KX96_9HYME|nr:hypothetical protein K0M31_000871 [Melipona bicolor]
MGIIIGWGKDGPYGTGTSELKYAILPIISNYDCSMYWAITEKHICTSAAYHKDTCQVNETRRFSLYCSLQLFARKCETFVVLLYFANIQGDSGGPLIVLVNNTPLQVGIVSYGDGFCPSNKPGVFTRVSPFIDWIQEVTNL